VTALLVAVTSLAVGVYASAWLVVPYLALMALVLVPPAVVFGRPRTTAGGEVPEPRGVTTGDAAGCGADDRSSFAPEAETDPDFPAEPGSASDADLATLPEPTAVKTRRGKGRGRKAKPGSPATAEPAGAAWIRVGPGKFVRADSLSPDVPPPPTSAPAGSSGASDQDQDGSDAGGPGESVTEVDADTPVDVNGPSRTDAEPSPHGGAPSGGLDDSEAQPSDVFGSADAVAVLPGEAFAPSSGPDPSAPVTEPAVRSGPEPEAARDVSEAVVGKATPESGLDVPDVFPEPQPGVGPALFAVDGLSQPAVPAAGVDGGSTSPDLVEVSRAHADTEPGGAAWSAPAPDGVPRTVLAWSLSWMDEPAPAIGPGESDAGGEGLVGWYGGLCLGLGVAEGITPGGPRVETSGDNGIAPDAPFEPTPDAGLVADPPASGFETAPTAAPEPEPAADLEAPAPVPPVACLLPPTAEAASVAVPETRPDGGGDDPESRLAPKIPAVRPSRLVSRGLAASSRGPSRRRNSAAVAAADNGRAAFVIGNVRRGRTARLPGSRLQSRRDRNVGRFRRVDRTHPPRSPPRALPSRMGSLPWWPGSSDPGRRALRGRRRRPD